MDQREWNFRHAGISAIVGFGLGWATTYIANSVGDPDPKLDALSSLLAGLMGVIFSMQMLQNRELGNIEKIADKALKGSLRAVKAGSINTNLIQKLNRISTLPDIVHDVALCGLDAAIDGIDVEKDVHTAIIPGRRLALICYARFWEDIVELQEKSKKRLIVRLTHSSEIDIFKEKDARSLKSLQTKFTKRGLVFRMLIDRDAQTIERVEAYLEAIQNMHGIYCVYINVYGHPYLLKDHEDLEFCIFEGLENYCSEWRVENSNQVQGYALTKAPRRYDESMEAWNGVLKHIRTYDYADDQVTDKQREKLRELQKSFLSKYKSAVSLRGPD